MSWWQQVAAFAERYTVITFDHRAFGRSPDIEGGPGRTAFGSDLLALLDGLGVGPVHFVAHSMGARTAIGLLRLDPQRLRSLTVSGSNAGCVDDRLRERKAELEASGALDGTLIRPVPEKNAAYYGAGTTTKDIMISRTVTASGAAGLKAALTAN